MALASWRARIHDVTGTRTAKPVPPEVIERLKAAVGPAGTLDDPADMAPYCKSFRDDWEGRVPSC